MSNQKEQENNDYKYIMQDAGNIYLGAKFSYDEIMENKDVSFKFKAIIEHYMTKEIDMETSLESHFYYMDLKSFGARTYEQLRVKLKISERRKKKSLLGKEKIVYEEKIYKLQEFTAIPAEEKKKRGIMIQEIMIPKMALLMFPV